MLVPKHSERNETGEDEPTSEIGSQYQSKYHYFFRYKNFTYVRKYQKNTNSQPPTTIMYHVRQNRCGVPA
jgi:hypothetical protein